MDTMLSEQTEQLTALTMLQERFSSSVTADEF